MNKEDFITPELLKKISICEATVRNQGARNNSVRINGVDHIIFYRSRKITEKDIADFLDKTYGKNWSWNPR